MLVLTVAYPEYIVLDGGEEQLLLPDGHVPLHALEEQLTVIERDDVEEVREQRGRHRRVHHAPPRRLDAEVDRLLAGPDLGVRLGQLAQHVHLEGVLHRQPLHLVVAGMGYYYTPCPRDHWLYPPRETFDAAQDVGRGQESMKGSSMEYPPNGDNSENSLTSPAAGPSYPSNSLKPLERSEKSVAENEEASRVSHFFVRMPNAIVDATCL